MTLIILAVFGILAGIGASLFGFGGGFVVVPLLYKLLGSEHPQTMHVAIATSTAVMVVSASYATFRHHRKGYLPWRMVFPFAFYIGIGSSLGVLGSSIADGEILRYLFIAYLVYTIAECVFSKSFVQRHPSIELRSLEQLQQVGFGLIIGAVATMLGVGGSVMTVPLMRRSGATMTEAVALANPLSIPVAIVGVTGYAIMAHHQHISSGEQYSGFIYTPAFILLTVGALIGVNLGTKVVHKIPDRTHAIVYIALLCLVTTVMVFK